MPDGALKDWPEVTFEAASISIDAYDIDVDIKFRFLYG